MRIEEGRWPITEGLRPPVIGDHQTEVLVGVLNPDWARQKAYFKTFSSLLPPAICPLPCPKGDNEIC